MSSSVILRIALSAAIVTVALSYDLRDFSLEEPCAEAGGTCLLKEECSEDIPQEYLGLCPKQRNEGVECCHGISKNEHRCRRLGGECFSKDDQCPESFQLTRATDCPEDETCCLLV